jgi:hypothetical protein
MVTVLAIEATTIVKEKTWESYIKKVVKGEF